MELFIDKTTADIATAFMVGLMFGVLVGWLVLLPYALKDRSSVTNNHLHLHRSDSPTPGANMLEVRHDSR